MDEATAAEEHIAWARAVNDAAAGASTGRAYVNFLGDAGAGRSSYGAETYGRLAALKREYDPPTSSGSTRTSSRSGGERGGTDPRGLSLRPQRSQAWSAMKSQIGLYWKLPSRFETSSGECEFTIGTQ